MAIACETGQNISGLGEEGPLCKSMDFEDRRGSDRGRPFPAWSNQSKDIPVVAASAGPALKPPGTERFGF
jgi:hypothetical protein